MHTGTYMSVQVRPADHQLILIINIFIYFKLTLDKNSQHTTF